MKNILVSATKGGVGKSTCADEIAFSFERTHTPMTFYNLDPQGGTCHDTSEVDDAVVAVIDTPPGVNKEMSGWFKNADVIVVPTDMTPKAVEPLRRMRSMVETVSDKKVLYVLNKWDHYTLAKQFEEWFKEEFEHERYVVLPDSIEIARASGFGRSALEGKGGTQQMRFLLQRMVNTVRKMADLPEERFGLTEDQKRTRNQDVRESLNGGAAYAYR